MNSKFDYQYLTMRTGQLIANYNNFFDKEGPEFRRQFKNNIVIIEDILNETPIIDPNDPNVYLSLARNPGIRRLVIELFKLRLREYGRSENDIIEDIEDEENITDASIAIVLASILLTSEVNLTNLYSATEVDLANYLIRLKKVYYKKTYMGVPPFAQPPQGVAQEIHNAYVNFDPPVGGKHFRKTKYSRKRKTKRRHSTRRKTRRKRRTRRK